MFCKIELLPKQSIAEEKATELLWTFLCSLERNGQILKDYKLVKSDIYVIYATLPKADSLDEKYDGIYVKRDRKKINEIYDLTITPIGQNLESHPYCICKKRSAMEMQTYTLDIDSVFTCCDCGNPIALYELPLPDNHQEDFYSVQDWQENFSSIDILWMNCFCDRYTGNQRVKVDSALNKQGIKIAESMQKQLGYPVYYHLECDYGKSTKTENAGDRKIHICPKCGKRMKRILFSHDYKRDICEKCNLSYDTHENESKPAQDGQEQAL